MNKSGDVTSTNPDGPTPATDPKLLRRLDAIIALLAVIAAALVLDLVEVNGRGTVVVILVVAVGLFAWTAILAQSDE